jgi:hypothetical protein
VPGDLVTEVRQATVIDPNGNLSDHFFNADFHEVRRQTFTNRDVNPQDPAQFETTKSWSRGRGGCRPILPRVRDPKAKECV